MQHLAAKGWVCVAINYRLAPRDPFPAQIIDVKRAIAWIREHIAEYGGDPDYIAITGGSAGGHLTALAAVTPNDPDLPARLRGRRHQRRRSPSRTTASTTSPARPACARRADARQVPRPRGSCRRRWADDPERLRGRHSPAARSPRTPPTSSSCTAPTTRWSPVDQARLFVARLREISGATVVYAELPGAQHAFDVFPSIRSAHVVRAIDRYLHWHWNGWRRERAA